MVISSKLLVIDSKNDEIFVGQFRHESQGHTCIKNDKELFEEVEALLEGDEEEQINAFNLLLENQFKFHSCPDFLWRLAQAHKFLATTNGNLINLGSKEKLINDGKSLLFT